MENLFIAFDGGKCQKDHFVVSGGSSDCKFCILCQEEFLLTAKAAFYTRKLTG